MALKLETNITLDNIQYAVDNIQYIIIDGRTVDPQLVKMTIASETERRLVRAGSVVNRIPEASELLEKFVMEPELSDFLTLDAYGMSYMCVWYMVAYVSSNFRAVYRNFLNLF